MPFAKHYVDITDNWGGAGRSVYGIKAPTPRDAIAFLANRRTLACP